MPSRSERAAWKKRMLRAVCRPCQPCGHASRLVGSANRSRFPCQAGVMMCNMESGEARKSEYGVWQGFVWRSEQKGVSAVVGGHCRGISPRALVPHRAFTLGQRPHTFRSLVLRQRRRRTWQSAPESRHCLSRWLVPRLRSPTVSRFLFPFPCCGRNRRFTQEGSSTLSQPPILPPVSEQCSRA